MSNREGIPHVQGFPVFQRETNIWMNRAVSLLVLSTSLLVGHISADRGTCAERKNCLFDIRSFYAYLMSVGRKISMCVGSRHWRCQSWLYGIIEPIDQEGDERIQWTQITCRGASLALCDFVCGRRGFAVELQ